MALIHEDLYREDHLSGVSMDVYLNKLANDIFRVYNIAPDRISMQTDIEPIRLDVETVIPIGLIVNELITNALKHAFPGERSGCIYLYLKEQADQLILTLEDDGQGLKEKGTAGSFGMSMIETFQEKLEGHTQLESQNGTRIRMTIHNYKKLEPVLA
jgi:two-component sensor histidine kinase